jgi:quercetin dioxygenase-like cupin family protein
VTPLATRDSPPRPDRPSSRLLLDSGHVRVVTFHLGPGQEVKPHRSPSTVLAQAIEGEGELSGGDGGITLAAGDAAVFERRGTHEIRTLDVPLRLLAIITARPS